MNSNKVLLMWLRTTKMQDKPQISLDCMSFAVTFFPLRFFSISSCHQLCKRKSSRIPGKVSSIATESKAVVGRYLHLALVCVSWQSVGKRSQKYFLENVFVPMSEGIYLLITVECEQITRVRANSDLTCCQKGALHIMRELVIAEFFESEIRKYRTRQESYLNARKSYLKVVYILKSRYVS